MNYQTFSVLFECRQVLTIFLNAHGAVLIQNCITQMFAWQIFETSTGIQSMVRAVSFRVISSLSHLIVFLR